MELIGGAGKESKKLLGMLNLSCKGILKTLPKNGSTFRHGWMFGKILSNLIGTLNEKRIQTITQHSIICSMVLSIRKGGKLKQSKTYNFLLYWVY